MIRTALVAMTIAILGQHLGLFEAVAKIAVRISQCPKCSTFWCVLVVLLFTGTDPLVAIGASILAAYISYWAGILLIVANNLYTRLWQRVQRK